MSDACARRGTDRNQFSPLQLTVIIFVVCSAFSSQMVMPLWIGAIIDDFGLSESTAGKIASTEFATVAIVSLLLAIYIRHFQARPTVWIGLVLLISGNLLSGIAESALVLAVFRALTGIGKGLVVAMIFSMAAGTEFPTRTFAVLNASYALFSMVFYLVVPFFVTSGGATGAFLFMGCIAGAGALLMIFFPADSARVSRFENTRSGKLPLFGVLAFLGLALLWSGHNAVWTFIERLGITAGLSVKEIGVVLSVAAFFTIGGPSLARIIDTRWGMIAPILSVLIVKMGVVFLIVRFPSPMVYSATVPLFLLSALFIVPYVMGILSIADPAGRLAAASSAAMTAGSSMGALVGGMTVDFGGYDGLALTAIVHFLAVLLIFGSIAGAVRKFSTPRPVAVAGKTQE